MVMKYVSVSQMQSIEREADAKGFSYAQMMQKAGQNLADVLIENYEFMAEEGVLALVGAGNNGGDALVALTRLSEANWGTAAILLRPRPGDDPVGEAYRLKGGKIYDFSAGIDEAKLSNLLSEHAILLDGVLGTGARLPLKPELAALMAQIKQAVKNAQFPVTVIAVDCPSGMDCDSGKTAPETLKAERTITMAAIKQGMLTFPANSYCGEIDVVGIGLPEDGKTLDAWQAIKSFVPDQAWVHDHLPARPDDAHKGTFGTALVVGGSQAYTGAVWLCGQAAYRIGAGLVRLAVPRSLHPALAGVFPEATWELLPEEEGFISQAAAKQARQAMEHATALVIGPGFGLHASSQSFLDALLPIEDSQDNPAGQASPSALPPAVIDADGLKLLARLKDWPKRLPPGSVLTPHPGEMALITGLSREQIQADRLGVARRFSQAWGHVVVLKGAFTIIAEPGGATAVIPVASAALARAGTGDVLAGLVGGLRAQGAPGFEAATTAAWIHAHAGLQAAAEHGSQASVLAGDLLPAVITILSDL